MGDRSPVLQWERRGGLKRSGGLEWVGATAGLEWSAGLDWKPGVVARSQTEAWQGSLSWEAPRISKQLTLSGTVSLLEIKRERRHFAG